MLTRASGPCLHGLKIEAMSIFKSRESAYASCFYSLDCFNITLASKVLFFCFLLRNSLKPIKLTQLIDPPDGAAGHESCELRIDRNRIIGYRRRQFFKLFDLNGDPVETRVFGLPCPIELTEVFLDREPPLEWTFGSMPAVLVRETAEDLDRKLGL